MIIRIIPLFANNLCISSYLSLILELHTYYNNFIHELQFKIIISGDNIAHGFRGLCVIYLFDHFSTSLKEIAIEFQQCLSGA